MGDTPAVFWFPLSFVTTPTFAGAVLALRFLLTFAFVCTGALLFAESDAHAAPKLSTAIAQRRVRFRRIFSPFVDSTALVDIFANCVGRGATSEGGRTAPSPSVGTHI